MSAPQIRSGRGFDCHLCSSRFAAVTVCEQVGNAWQSTFHSGPFVEGCAILRPVELSESDRHHIRAAEGWLELDHALEANEELEQIAPENRSHPVVLFLRCRIYLELHRADYTHTIATTLTEQLPERPEGWFYLACACSRMGNQDDARAAVKKCFAAAVHAGTEKEWQQRALDTRDLDGMWTQEQKDL